MEYIQRITIENNKEEDLYIVFVKYETGNTLRTKFAYLRDATEYAMRLALEEQAKDEIPF